MMKHIIHDWDEASCLRILGACRRAELLTGSRQPAQRGQPELLERHSRLLLIGHKATRQRSREHPTEVADQGSDHAADGGSFRTINS